MVLFLESATVFLVRGFPRCFDRSHGAGHGMTIHGWPWRPDAGLGGPEVSACDRHDAASVRGGAEDSWEAKQRSQLVVGHVWRMGKGVHFLLMLTDVGGGPEGIAEMCQTMPSIYPLDT